MNACKPLVNGAPLAQVFRSTKVGGGMAAAVGAGKAATAAAVDGLALVGRTVEKEFDGEMFTGCVTGFDPKLAWYRVVYSDGDSERLEVDVLEGIIVR